MQIIFRVLLFIYPVVAHIAILTDRVDWALVYLLVVACLSSISNFSSLKFIVHAASGIPVVLILAYLMLSNSDDWLIFLPPVLIPAWLAFIFLRSLTSETAFITQLAQKMEDDALDERQIRYTRTVTAVWGVVFLIMICESVLLALYAPFQVWSWWVHVGNYFIIALLFSIEFLFRYFLLGRPVNLKGMFQAYLRKDSS